MHWPGPMVLEFSSCLVVSAPPVGHFSSGSSHPLFFYCKMSLQYHLVASFNVQCVWHHNPATGFQPPSAIVVSAEPFSHGTGTLRCLGNGETQMMSHIVKSCLLTKLYCGLSRLHSADEDAVLWLTNCGSCHALFYIVFRVILKTFTIFNFTLW